MKTFALPPNNVHLDLGKKSNTATTYKSKHKTLPEKKTGHQKLIMKLDHGTLLASASHVIVIRACVIKIRDYKNFASTFLPGKPLNGIS